MTDDDPPKHPFDIARERLSDVQNTTVKRRLRERVLSPNDGRVLRSKGKTETVTYRVTPKFKRDVHELAKAEGVTMTEILERAVEEYKQNRMRSK